MKRLLAGFIIFISFSMPLFSQQGVFVEELESAPAGDLDFINYSGPHLRIDTASEITGIGYYLGRTVQPGAGTGEAGYFGKYRVLHLVDPDDINGLDADIFIIEESAQVDHIDNLRRIIAGYLEVSYGYSPERSILLAKFITVYNAVRRGDTEYFSARYKKLVNSSLDPQKSGLAMSYDQWPGNTMMLIPLAPPSDGKGLPANLESDVLTEPEVIDALREEPGKAVEERREMIIMKEEEIAEEKAAIEQERDRIETERQALSVPQEPNSEPEAEPSGTAAEEPAGKSAEQPSGKPAEELSGEEQASSQESLQDKDVVKTEEVQAAEDPVITEKKQELDAAEAELSLREERITEREERVIQEREELASDQMELIEKEEAQAAPEVRKGIFVIRRETPSGILGRAAVYNLDTGEILDASDATSIRSPLSAVPDGKYAAVAGETGGNRLISLILIDGESLETVKTAEIPVSAFCTPATDGSSIYAVVEYDGDWRLGIFNMELELESVSRDAVFMGSDIIFSGGRIAVQGSGGNVLLPDKEDFIRPE